MSLWAEPMIDDKNFIGHKQYYTIGDVAKITGLKEHTLRHWEKKGLITPLRKDPKRRLYRQTEIDLINEIKSWHKHGLSLKGIKDKMNEEKRKKRLHPELGMDVDVLPDAKILKDIKAELLQVLKLLNH
jgi:DNA-binding transcriptional MerR regulator